MVMTELDYNALGAIMGGRDYQEWHRDGMNELFYVLKDIDKIKEMIKDDYEHGDFWTTPERIKEFRLAMRLLVSDWLNNQFRLRRYGLDGDVTHAQIWPKDGGSD